jgi:hypothetical protein
MSGKVSWSIAVVAVAVALVAGRLGQVFYRRAEQFEAKARLALDFQHAKQVEVDMLQDRVNVLEDRLGKQHRQTTVARREVAVADSVSHPDTSCAPSIAARDAVIASQDGEISLLHEQNEARAGQITLLQASNQALKSALDARPKLYPRIVGPNIGVGVFAGVVGVQSNGKPALGVGVGVTLNVFSVRF